MIQPEETPANDGDIERRRAKWVKEKRAEHLDFIKQFSFHSSATFMDYLHSDVKEEEAWLACLYEYMRESQILRETASRRDELMANGLDGFDDAQRAAWKKLNVAQRNEKAALWAVEELREQPQFIMELVSFLECESFPKKDWQELSPAEREGILRLHRSVKTPPLVVPDAWTLKAMGTLDKFKEMGEKAKPVIEDHDPQRGKFARPYKPVPAILQQHESLHHVIFSLDFSEKETHLAKRFAVWLKLPEIQTLLGKHERPKRPAIADAPLDRLKDLAAWRLYRESGNDWNKANNFADKHRKCFSDQAECRRANKDLAKNDPRRYKLGHKRPFRDAKQKIEKQESGTPQIIQANRADLFGSDADPIKAQASAWKHLVELRPTEFAAPPPHMLEILVELEKLASKG